MMRARLAAFGLAAILAFPLAAIGQTPPGELTFTPEAGIVGTAVTARATGLPPGVRYTLVWRSGNPHWRTADGKFFGIEAPEAARPVASGVSDARGALALRFTVPEDFGYLHDVELHAAGGAADAQPAATQGFTVVPHLALASRAGPPGSPIAITVTGLGYRFYQVVWHLLYDGAQTGWLSAVTTHGTARVTIPATGAIGLHTLQAIEGPTAPYLNGQQSPNAQAAIPQVIAATYRIVPGPAVRPLPAAAQQPPRLAGTSAADAIKAALATDAGSGPVGSAIVVNGSHFTPHGNVTLTWETLAGNRLSGSGWSTVERPLATASADAAGAFAVHVRTPEDLGGTHRIIARAGEGEATAAYTIVPSVDEIAPRVVHPGDTFTLHVHGVGWTETANTYTTVLDNGFIGYECGFNSGGDVVVRLRAPGRIGVHYVDLYPTIYRGQVLGPGAPPPGAQVNGIYFLLPMLNAPDHPGEALPAFHLSFDVR
jgi:hypothetical protein